MMHHYLLSLPAYFAGRLEYIKGHSESYKLNKGYARVKHGTNYYFICADNSWNQTAADVFCRSVGLEPSNGLPDVSPITEWDTNELFAVMSEVKCSEDVDNFLECSHRFGLVTCPDNNFATASCIAPSVTTRVTPFQPQQERSSRGKCPCKP